VEVAGDAGVGAVAGAGDAVEGLLKHIRGGDTLGEGDGLVAEFGFGVDQDGFVDQILLEEAAVEVGAALEQEAEDVALGECGEDGGEAKASSLVGDCFNLCAMVGERGDFGAGRGFTAQDQQIGVAGVFAVVG